MANNIRYLCDTGTGIEMVFCENSTISYPLHNHISVFTIGIILDGSLLLTTDQGTNLYTKNQTFCVFPYTPHSISTTNGYTLLTLCINKMRLGFQNSDFVKSDVINLLTGTSVMSKVSKQQIFQLLDCLNLCIGRFVDISDTTIDVIKNQLELYPENKISIEQMAQLAFISKYHFIRDFKQKVGLTPHQFQMQNRIRKAQRLISNSKTITEVALITGFCDQSHFIKQFEKYVGLTPTTYKICAEVLCSDLAKSRHEFSKQI